MRFPPRTFLPGALAVALATVVCVPSPAFAAGSGGTSAPAPGVAPVAPTGGAAPRARGGAPAPEPPPHRQAPPPRPPPRAVAPTGGTAPGAVAETPAPKPPRKRKRSTPRPTLVAFHANARRFYDLGRPARVVFRIDGRSASVRVKLQVRRAGSVIRTIDLGDQTTGHEHSLSLTGREGGRLPEGTVQLRLTARDPRGRGLRATGRASAIDSLGFYWHRFPLGGPFT